MISLKDKIKCELAVALEKQGSSLLELENDLRNLNTQEGVLGFTEKLAAISPIYKEAAVDVAELLKGLLYGAGALSLGVGATVGLGGILADKSLDKQDRQLKQKEQEIKQTQKLIDQLKAGYNV